MKASMIQIIQTMLVPGVMVSACALLLLGMNSKHSTIVNRIRLLKDEERRLEGSSAADPKDDRRESIAVQLPLLMARLRLVSHIVSAYSIGIIFFILSSFFIGLQFLTQTKVVQVGMVCAFLAGMLCVLAGVFFNAVEIRRGLEVVRIEVDEAGFSQED